MSTQEVLDTRPLFVHLVHPVTAPIPVVPMEGPRYRGLRSSFFAGAGLIMLFALWLNLNTAELTEQRARINPGVYIDAGTMGPP